MPHIIYKDGTDPPSGRQSVESVRKWDVMAGERAAGLAGCFVSVPWTEGA